MRLARLPLAALALVALAACSSDATGPDHLTRRAEMGSIAPSGPVLSGYLMGSGMKEAADSIIASGSSGTDGAVLDPS